MIEIDTTVGVAMPTAADWGQLYQFNSTGDAGLIMPPRSYYTRQFFSGGWADLAMGAIICATGTAGSQTSLVAESQTTNALVNLPQIGLTSANSTGAVNVASNPIFAGLCGIMGGVTQLMISPKEIAYLQATLINNGNTQVNGAAQVLPLSSGTDDTQFVMWGLRFTFDPINEILYINFATETGITLTADTQDETILNPFLQGISNSSSTAIGNLALANNSLLDSFFIYWPYVNNQLKLHCVGLVNLG